MITLLLPLLALAQPADCPINPEAAGVVANIAAGGRALELRKDGAFCRVELDCTLRARPTGLRYDLATLKGLKTAPVATQMTNITFQFADGTSQTCNSTGAKASRQDTPAAPAKPASTPPGTLPGDPIPIKAN